MYRVEIDRELCSGFGSCVDDAPEVFELDSSGTSTLRLTETDDEKVLTAAAGCPMSAISVFDAGSGERVT